MKILCECRANANLTLNKFHYFTKADESVRTTAKLQTQ